jgi:hypothetical protein
MICTIDFKKGSASMNETARDARAARLAYMKAWRRNNRDKIRVYQERYWQKKSEMEERAIKEEIALSLSK